MQVLVSIFVFVIAGYLQAVQGLADVISLALPESAPIVEETEIPEPEVASEPEPEPELVQESSTIGGGTIPQVLIENAAYQKAAVVESIQPQEATSTAYDALVNIFCEHHQGNRIRVTTGTGFFIDTDGIILTNAHVAHFLLMDGIMGDTECVIRTGNPAEAKYMADLLYISPSWVRDNADVFTEAAPKGTGERDYALLYITSGVDGAPMPRVFPALPFATELLKRSTVDDQVYVAGYPAEELVRSGGRSPLVPKLATSSVTELMTFGSNYADIFSLAGTDVGEQGASGGPVITESGDAIGLIATKGDASEFGAGALRAITMSYIDRTIEEETGFNLRQNLGGDIPHRASIFNQTMVPFLRVLLDQAQ